MLRQGIIFVPPAVAGFKKPENKPMYVTVLQRAMQGSGSNKPAF